MNEEQTERFVKAVELIANSLQDIAYFAGGNLSDVATAIENVGTYIDEMNNKEE